jgi:hypothetical protein
MHHGDHPRRAGRSAYRRSPRASAISRSASAWSSFSRPAGSASRSGSRVRRKLIQAYGLREIATGVGILAPRNPAPWIWARVGGDALDIATLSSGCPTGQRRTNAGLAIASVMGVTALDVTCAVGLQRRRARKRC